MALTKLPKNALGTGSVDASKIEDGTIQTAELSGTVTADKLNATLNLSSKTVTLPNTSVTSDMLANTTVANAKLSNSSITINGTSIALGVSAEVGVDFNWQSVQTSDFTAAAGNGYFVNTTSAVVEVTLPSSASIGDQIAIKDYAGTFATNNLTIARNGHNIQGVANDSLIKTNRASLVLIYVDSTKGWLFTDEHNVADLKVGFVAATGGTVATDGDFKVHSFLGDGCFVVSCAGNPGGSTSVQTLVVAGGGGGGYSGGGGAGGFRLISCHSVTAQTYPISVGAGGTGTPVPAAAVAPSGSNSVFSTITSAGGGGGGHYDQATPRDGANGGSGGGGARCGNGGSGNTPSVSPPQGNNGGGGVPGREGGGGGAATAGTIGSPNPGTGAGGSGSPAAPVFGAAPKPFYLTDEANDSDGNNVSGPVANGHFAGGGAGAVTPACASKIAFGSLGGGGRAGTGHPNPFAPASMTSGTGRTNSGGGGGGNYSGTASNAGSGIVLIRYKFQ